MMQSETNRQKNEQILQNSLVYFGALDNQIINLLQILPGNIASFI